MYAKIFDRSFFSVIAHRLLAPSRRNPLPIESPDDAILNMLGGANFGPDAKLILPSGLVLDGREAQVFTSLFAAESSPPDMPTKESELEEVIPLRYEDDPLSSEFDDWTGDPMIDSRRLVQRACDAIKTPTNQETTQPLGYADISGSKDIKAPKKKSNWMKRLFGWST